MVSWACKASTDEEIRQFLTDLAVTHQVAASTQNQALSALLFLYNNVLCQDFGWIENIVRAKKPRRLPVVLSRDAECQKSL